MISRPTRSDGDRVSCSAAFVSRRPIKTGGNDLWRLLFEAQGERIAVLVSPTYGGFPLPGRTAETYLIQDAIVVATAPDDAADVDRSCPECGGGLRGGTALDAMHGVPLSALEEVDSSACRVVADAGTRIVRGDNSRDDVSRVDAIESPAAVCRECGATISSLAEC